MKSLIMCVVLCLAVIAMPAYSQQQRGDVELQFQGYYFTTVGQEFSFGSGNLAAKIGPYLTDNLQVGIGPTLSITTITTATFNPTTLSIDKESNTTTTFGSTLFFVYSFLSRNGKLVPYFGANYFKQDFSDSEDKGSVGVNLGAKYYFAKKAAFDVSGNYLFTLNKDQEGGMLYFAVGISFLL
jgi:hypothetical protein